MLNKNITKTYLKNNSAFTLVETIICIALFMTILTTFSIISLTYIRSMRVINSNINIRRGADRTLTILTTKIRTALTVNFEDSNCYQLQLTNPKGEKVRYEIVNNKFYRKRNAGTNLLLTGLNNKQLQKPVFEYFSEKNLVSITLIIQDEREGGKINTYSTDIMINRYNDQKKLY